MTSEKQPEGPSAAKTHRLRWHAANTGVEWYSQPLTQQDAEMAAAHIRDSHEHRQANITATAEQVPEEMISTGVEWAPGDVAEATRRLHRPATQNIPVRAEPSAEIYKKVESDEADS